MISYERIGDIAIANVDCITVMDQMGHGSVDLVVTDPPYLMGYQTNHRQTKNASKGSRESLLQKKIKNDSGASGKVFIRKYMQRCYRVLKEDSAIYVFCKMDSGEDDLLFFFKSQMRKAGFKIANTIIWKKDNWTAGDLEGAFGFQYEVILFGHKGRPKIRGHRHPDVWEFDRVPDGERIHPNQKPLPLLARCLESSSGEGDLIFDGCAGSGSLGIACHLTNRKAFLCEYDDERFQAMESYVRSKINEDLFTGI